MENFVAFRSILFFDDLREKGEHLALSSRDGQNAGVKISPEKAAELKVKHLEMVQAIVARLSNSAATLKNYCITLTTAVCGFAISLQRPLVVMVALLPITIFALLDAQYLRTERRFRGLFDIVRSEDWGTLPNFEINLEAAPKIGYWRVFRSWSIATFYAPLAVGTMIVALIAGIVYGRFL